MVALETFGLLPGKRPLLYGVQNERTLITNRGYWNSGVYWVQKWRLPLDEGENYVPIGFAGSTTGVFPYGIALTFPDHWPPI